MLWQSFECGYDLNLNNSSLTRDQISKYCNDQIQETDINLKRSDDSRIMIIFHNYRLDNNWNWMWHMAYTIRKITIIRRERTDAPSAGVSIEIKNNTGIKEDDWFTPKKVIAYCLIVGLISGTLSIFMNSLIVLSTAAFVFASITLWYMFGDKFHRWEERRRRTKDKYFL